SIGAEKIDHRESQSLVEVGQQQTRATLWQRPDFYLDQSAVLHADRVTTPMLLIHNKLDGIVHWRQGVEWYMALRRLRKRVWMLQYDNGIHFNEGRDAEDVTLRMNQFFDYYLKGVAPAKWMTQGIPANLKGIDSGFALDNSDTKP